MRKLLSILLASTMIISVASMINVSAANPTVAPTEPTTEVIEITEPTIDATEPTTEETQSEATDQKENTYKDFTYSVKGKAVTITKYTGSAKSVTIPSEIDGKKVRVIGPKAFKADNKKNKTLEKVTIPDSVYKIKASAFYNCVNLSKIFFGKNVKHIGARAFEGCKSLKEFKTPPKVNKLTDDVLTRTGIKYLYIGKNVKTINSSSFHNMFNKPMEKITVAKNNKNYSSEDGVLYNKKKTRLILCPPSLKRKNLTLPSTVKLIESDAFHYNKNLRTVILSNKLKTISSGAFSSCKNLKKLTVPKSVERIYEYAFSSSKLSKITILNKDVRVEDYAFSSSGIKTFEVTHTISGGFWGCKKLQKITISSNVTAIGTKQFIDCPKLKSVTIPKTVKHIGKKAFGFKYKIVNGFYEGVIKVKGFTIKGVKNSAAHKYAKKHGFKFVEIS